MNKTKALLASLLLVFLTLAVFLHFRDDAPPDLSRFTRPAHDPVAFAQVKALTDTFTAQFHEYAPVEDGDPDDDAAPDLQHTLNALALKRDAHAVRALRRHLKENEAALATAHELVRLKTFSYEPIPPGNPFSTPIHTFQRVRTALRLLEREALLAGIDGKTEAAWTTLADCLESARTWERATHSLISGLMNAGNESRALDAANTLAGAETDPAKIRKFLQHLERHAPDPLSFRQAFSAELLCLADSLMPSRGGTLLKTNPFDFTFAFGGAGPASKTRLDELRAQADSVRKYWLWHNTLPNATVAQYAKRMDAELADQTPIGPPHTPIPTGGLRILLRNSGGQALLGMTTPSYSLFRSKHFRLRAQHDLTRVALALRVYQLEHEGRRPASLAELAPGILAAVPPDLFDGKPLRYDPADGRAWSVGPDLKDDAGAVDAEGDSNDVVVKPR